MPQVKQRKAKPVKFTSYTQNYGVKESLVWPDGSQKDSSSQHTNYVLPKRGDIGKPSTRGYLPFDHLATKHDPRDDYHVIDALRGWPQTSQNNQQQEEDVDQQLYTETDLEREARLRNEKAKSKKNKQQKSNRRVGTDLEGSSSEPDPHIADLISHRFMTEGEKERIQVKAQLLEAARQQAKLEYERKFPKDIKGTKASQLRSIAKAEKVVYDPKSLWQMSKFKDSAQPHLETFRKKSSEEGNKGVSYKDGIVNYKMFMTSSDHQPNAGTPEPELEFPKDNEDIDA